MVIYLHVAGTYPSNLDLKAMRATSNPMTWRDKTATTQFLDEDRQLTIIRELEERFSWDADLQGMVPARHWESRTALLYEFQAPDDVAAAIVKIGKSWTGEEASEIYSDMVQVHSILAARDDLAIDVPPMLGWLESPALICQIRVEGEDLGAAIATRHRYLDTDVNEAVVLAGSALGLFHTATLVDDAEVDDKVYHAVRSELRKMARRLLIDPSSKPANLGSGVPLSRKYGDFLPHNFVLGDRGHVWVLDQPARHTLLPVHRDVALFLDRLSTRVGRDEPGDRAEVSSTVSRLQDAFMSGYRATGPSKLDSSYDRWLINLYRSYRSLSTALKRVRQRRYADVAVSLRSAALWRRETIESL